MLLQSSVLFWALFQLLISGSQCNPREKRQGPEQWTPWVQDACIKDGTKLGPTRYGATAAGVECKNWCDETQGCVSVDYRPHSDDRECRLSSDSRHQPCDLRRVGTEFAAKITVQEAAIARICPGGWKSIDSKCYHGIPFDSAIRTWREARSYCVNIDKKFPGAAGADLASVEDLTSLNAYLKKEVDAPGYWVGGYKFDIEPYPKTRWLWLNRKPITLSESITEDDKNCLYMADTGAFNMYQCDTAGEAGYGVVCQLY